MRSILVGVVVAVVAVGGPAFGGAIVDDLERRPVPATEPVAPPPAKECLPVNQTPPFADVVEEDYHSAGAEFGLGVASSVMNIFYTPVRLAVGIVGASLGGVEGWLTGGDLRTARSMWRPTVEGNYFVRPDHLDRTKHYQFGNCNLAVRDRYTPVCSHEAAQEHEETVAAAPLEPEVVPAEPELEDGATSDDR